VSVRPWPHSGICIWVPSFWTRRTLGYYAWGPSGTLLKEQGSYNLVQNMGHKGPVPRCIGPGRARTQILFYSIGNVFRNVTSKLGGGAMNLNMALLFTPELLE